MTTWQVVQLIALGALNVALLGGVVGLAWCIWGMVQNRDE